MRHKSLTVRLAAACLFVGCAIAQAPTSTLVGRVVDTTNAPAPGVAVSVRSQETNLTRTAETQADGKYIICALSPGPNEVTITEQGFRAATEPRIVLHADQSARVDVELNIGAVAEKVEVQSSVTVLNTENATLGDVVTPAQIAEIIKRLRDGRSSRN